MKEVGMFASSTRRFPRRHSEQIDAMRDAWFQGLPHNYRSVHAMALKCYPLRTVLYNLATKPSVKSDSTLRCVGNHNQRPRLQFESSLFSKLGKRLGQSITKNLLLVPQNYGDIRSNSNTPWLLHLFNAASWRHYPPTREKPGQRARWFRLLPARPN